MTSPNSRRPIPARRFRHAVRAFAALASLAGASLLAPTVAVAQDFTAMINQQMAQMNQMLAQGQNQVNGIVQQRMRDPQVQAAYRNHQAQAARQGVRPYDFPTFTYYYVYTNGFSAQGMAHMRATEAGNQAREQAAVRGLRQAEANRGAAQNAQSAAFSRNQQEAGRQLMGNSTFTATNGAQIVLPHTWQANSYNHHQGNTYYVDASGRYHVYSNGFWHALSR